MKSKEAQPTREYTYNLMKHWYRQGKRALLQTSCLQMKDADVASCAPPVVAEGCAVLPPPLLGEFPLRGD